MLPFAYTHLSTLFLRAARGKNIELREWQRGTVGHPGGWTYHAKGIWVTFPPPSTSPSTSTTSTSPAKAGERKEDTEPAGPSVTLIGSSNYTTRSYGLDLEVGAMLVTTDEGLQKRWKREEEMLARYTKAVTEEELGTKDRRAGWKVRVAMWIVKILGGAL